MRPALDDSPFAWSAPALALRTDWRHELDAGELVQLAEALEHPEVRDRPAERIDTAPFDRPPLRQLCGRITACLRDGPGLFLLRGLPVADRAEPDLARMLWGLGSLLGVPVPQTVSGELIRRVEDRGADLALHSVRGHETSAALPLHADRCDVVALLCVRPAREGGDSTVVSTARAHEILRRRRPDLLRVLYEPFPNDQRGEEPPGSRPWLPLPVFSLVDGALVTRYVRRFIEACERFPDAPRLTSRQVMALDALDDALSDADATLQMRLQAGDLQFLNSHTTLHGRDAFADQGGPPRRLMLRLWLAPPWSYRLPPAFAPLYGSVEPGAVRGGIAACSG